VAVLAVRSFHPQTGFDGVVPFGKNSATPPAPLPPGLGLVLTAPARPRACGAEKRS
jgi:hypothetical protein